MMLRAIVATLFVCAMAGLLLAFIFGFERPNRGLLFLSSALLVGAVAAVFLHLHFTRVLDSSQKRHWLRRLTSRRAIAAWGDYVASEDLARSAETWTEESGE
jgi:hypothetical protein